MAKRAVFEALRGRGLRAELEFPVKGLFGDRRADVAVWSPQGQMVAIELQHTPIDLWEIERRAASYAKAGVAHMWVPFVPPSVWGRARRGESGWCVERYSARPFEKWLQEFTEGRGVWVFDARKGVLWRGYLAEHLLYREASTWFDGSGDEQYGGGYNYPSKRYRELTLVGPFALDSLNIRTIIRKPRRTSEGSWPGGRYAVFEPRSPTD